MSRYSPLPAEVLDMVAAAGFSVYQPTTGSKTYLFFTDGTRIGYLQRGDWGGLSISTVHKPNQRTGTGYLITEDCDPPPVLTRAELEKAFATAPYWAGAADRESIHKWPNMEAFLRGRTTVPLELVREGSDKK